MPPEKKPSEPFKNWFNEARYRAIADDFRALEPGFDRKRFLALTLTGLDGRELMDRLRQTAIAAEAALPGSYRDKLRVLLKAAPRLKHAFVSVAFCDFVARFGLEDFDHSFEALKTLTTFGSAEFAVRPYIQKDPARALAILVRWTRDSNEQVRRLASEGSRPRLPWGARLGAIIKNPDLTAPILEALKADPALYVRKSVANHLNDIAKDNPDWVLDRVSRWDRSSPGTDWIVRHGLRTLVKKGNPTALALCGADATAAKDITVSHFAVSPKTVLLGDRITLEIEMSSKAKAAVRVIIDYVVHYVKANGATSEKVFKWAKAELLPGDKLHLLKRQRIQDFTTRTHRAGRHKIELQVNGARLAETSFVLKTPER